MSNRSSEYIRGRREIKALPVVPAGAQECFQAAGCTESSRPAGQVRARGSFFQRKGLRPTADGAGRTPGAGARQADRASARPAADRRKRNRGARAAFTFGTRTIELNS